MKRVGFSAEKSGDLSSSSALTSRWFFRETNRSTASLYARSVASQATCLRATGSSSSA